MGKVYPVSIESVAAHIHWKVSKIPIQPLQCGAKEQTQSALGKQSKCLQ